MLRRTCRNPIPLRLRWRAALSPAARLWHFDSMVLFKRARQLHVSFRD